MDVEKPTVERRKKDDQCLTGAEPHIQNEDILGFPITRLSLERCVSQILTWIELRDSTHSIVCANPHSLHLTKNDHDFRDAILNASLVVPDGIGIVLASRILGGEIHERVTGSDIFQGVNDACNRRGGYSCFFLGSTTHTLATLHQKMSLIYPRVQVAGTWSPPFKARFTDRDVKTMLAEINQAKPDVLWVGMTAPKQEIWIEENRDRLEVPVVVGVGAVFDFFTGNVRRSHPVFQKAGLEWLPRLLQEPKRLWRRNFVSNPAFLGEVLSSKIRRTMKNS